ncbi:MAG: PfkB family carbohydrate kinase [Terracidiphilus sp.]
MKILTVGEILWDVFDHAEFLGGAPLNFSAAAERLGHSVTLITAVGDDERGRQAVESMQALGLSTEFVQILPGRETGTARVTTDSAGNASFYIQRPAAFDEIIVDESRLEAIAQVSPEWLYFGTLAPFYPPMEEILHRILGRLPSVKCFYDINLREGHWNLALVERLSDLASMVKLNDTEAETLFRLTQAGQEFSLEGFCRHWSSAHAVETICITLGERGCAIFERNVLQQFDGYAVRVVDTVGAGDAFAAAFLHGHELGWPTARAAAFANALGAQVASRAGATPAWTVDECWEMVALRTQK